MTTIAKAAVYGGAIMAALCVAGCGKTGQPTQSASPAQTAAPAPAAPMVAQTEDNPRPSTNPAAAGQTARPTTIPSLPAANR